MTFWSTIAYLIGFIIGLILWRIDKKEDYIIFDGDGVLWGVVTFALFPIITITLFFIISLIKFWTLFILLLIIIVVIIIYGDDIKQYIKKGKEEE